MLKTILNSIKVIVISLIIFITLVIYILPSTDSFSKGFEIYEQKKQELINQGYPESEHLKNGTAYGYALQNEPLIVASSFLISVLIASLIVWFVAIRKNSEAQGDNSLRESLKNVLSNIFLFTFAVFIKRSSKQLSYYFDMPKGIKIIAVTVYMLISLTMIFLFNISDINALSGISLNLVMLSYFKFLMLPVLVFVTLFSQGFQKKYQSYLFWISISFFFIDTIISSYIGFKIGANATQNMEDLNQLTTVLSFKNYVISFIVVTVFSLYAEIMKYATVRRQNVEAELKLAENLQKELIPQIEQNFNYMEVFGKSEAAEDVGGDYIDFIELDSNKSVLAVADVSGHNAVAGLLMSMLKTAFRTEIKYEQNPEKIANSLNQTIFQNKNKSMFISFLFGIVDKESKSFEFINAGHPPLLHYSSKVGTIEEHRTGDLALGLLQNHKFKTKSINFEKDDLLILFSDGIVENRNIEKEEWGIDGLKKLVQKSVDNSAKEIYESLLHEMNNFSASKIMDDITLLVVKIK